ncbi:MAG: D-2-hydroxyacid dehydrogenase [Phycisphaerae bacterium]|nr:D-2-hydroxyacid dehydrogenase [Phycisphaerae bacterium]
MKIVVLDGKTLNPGDNPWDAVEGLGQLTVYDRTSPDEILQRADGAEVLLTNKTPLSADTLGQLGSLRFISVLATGYNVVDVEAAGRQGVVVSNVPIYATDSVAQFTFAMLLELAHHVGAHDQAVKAGRWSESPDFCFWDSPLVELTGKKMGIVGFGRIGRRVGELAHAFGMEVLAADVNQANPPEYEPFQWVEVEELFEAADVVSLHCPQTAENVGIVNSELLARMKSNAFLINNSRGGLIVEADLAGALEAGRIAGAALDVVSAEPISPDNPLLSAKNCLITPHIAWATLAARRRLMQTTAENMAAFIAGKPINVVS